MLRLSRLHGCTLYMQLIHSEIFTHTLSRTDLSTLSKSHPHVINENTVDRSPCDGARTSVDMDVTLKFVNYKVGGTQTPYSFTETQYFFDLFLCQINAISIFQLQCDWAQIQVIVLTNDGNGFGFGISGSRNSGAVVRNIFPGGAADRVRHCIFFF